jgi:hypothetical protein
LGGHELLVQEGAAALNDMDIKAMQETINAVLQDWRQGDCVLASQWFVHRCDPQQPLTEEAKQNANAEVDLIESEVMGFAVITQTCDITRRCEERPFVEVVPLIPKDDQFLYEVKRGRRPQFAFIPGVAEHKLIADLDRIMTVEKAVITNWNRILGCLNDQQTRELGKALARKRTRFAFPDEFTHFVHQLQRKFQDKHSKQSDEGEALRALLEVRVRAASSWDAAEINLIFLFVRDEDEPTFKGTNWSQLLDQWLKLIPASEKFTSVEGQVLTLDDLTAKDYLESDPLDLDHLSISN